MNPVVRAFLDAHIRTVDDLHLLVEIAAHEHRWWDDAAVARELVIERKEARALLEHLAASNLLEIRVTGNVRYQYRPGTPELRAAARACIDAYRDDPGTVWSAIGRRGERAASDLLQTRSEGSTS